VRKAVSGIGHNLSNELSVLTLLDSLHDTGDRAVKQRIYQGFCSAGLYLKALT
jgi:hypothetical protein